MTATAKKSSLAGLGRTQTWPPSPDKPRRRRVRWTEEERLELIERGVEIVRSDPSGRISMLQALKRAMYKALPPERHRPLQAISPAHYQFFADGVEARLARPDTPAPPSDPPPAAETVTDTLDVVKAVGGLVQQVTSLALQVERLGDRLRPMEANSAVVQRLVVAMVKALDPAFLAQVGISDVPEPPPPLAIATHAPEGAAKLKVCVVGLRPAAEQKIRDVVNGRAHITCILDDAKALKVSFAKYDGVIITRHASHATFERANSQAGVPNVIRLRSTSADGVISAIGHLVSRRENERRRLYERGR